MEITLLYFMLNYMMINGKIYDDVMNSNLCSGNGEGDFW